MIVSLCRAEAGGRFGYVSLSVEGEDLLVVRESTILSGGHLLAGAEELFFRHATSEELDRAVAALLRARLRGGFELLYSFIPARRLPSAAAICREPRATPTPLDRWITSYLLPSSES